MSIKSETTVKKVTFFDQGFIKGREVIASDENGEYRFPLNVEGYEQGEAVTLDVWTIERKGEIYEINMVNNCINSTPDEVAEFIERM